MRHSFQEKVFLRLTGGQCNQSLTIFILDSLQQCTLRLEIHLVNLQSLRQILQAGYHILAFHLGQVWCKLLQRFLWSSTATLSRYIHLLVFFLFHLHRLLLIEHLLLQVPTSFLYYLSLFLMAQGHSKAFSLLQRILVIARSCK